MRETSEGADANADLRAGLLDARARTLALLEGLDPEEHRARRAWRRQDEGLTRLQLSVVNPLLWEAGHIAWFHERFVLRDLDRKPPIRADADALYRSLDLPPDARWRLALPPLQTTLAYMAAVQDEVIGRLQRGPMSPQAREVQAIGILHEDMHDETLVYGRQTLGYPAPGFAVPPDLALAAGPLPGDVAIPGGRFRLGAEPGHGGLVLDNEKWAHEVEVKPFHIARAPVTNAEFAAFVADGGYRARRFWDDAGWQWRSETGARHPLYWIAEGAGWQTRHFDRIVALALHQPVSHVSWHEAKAFCRWAGRRLPTELEWEVAAAAEPAGSGGLGSAKRRYPWGSATPGLAQANLDGRLLGTVDVAAFAAGDSAFGCRQMIGNVWEWTDSAFLPYPGFVPGPYQAYSAPWFGPLKVLRGGCFATRGRLVSNLYRNFFPPERRDLFAGLRTCAL